MGYKSAKNILPANLVKEIQKYISSYKRKFSKRKNITNELLEQRDTVNFLATTVKTIYRELIKIQLIQYKDGTFKNLNYPMKIIRRKAYYESM